MTTTNAPAGRPTTPPKTRRAKGSGGVSWDASKEAWKVTWPIPGRRPGTKRIKGPRALADNYLRERLREVDEGTIATDHRMTVGMWLRTWLDTHVEALAPGTRIRYRDISERLLIPAVGRIKLADLDDVHLAGLKADLMRPTAPGWWRPTTARSRWERHNAQGADSVLDVLSAGLGKATKGRRAPIKVNPRADVRRELKRTQVIDPPTPAEIEAMFAAVADKPERYAAFALSVGHGLRSGEVRGLRRGDRSRDGLRLTVSHKAERDGTLGTPKDGSTRTFTLKPWVAEALDALGPGKADDLYWPGARDPRKTMDGHTLLDWVHEASVGLRRRYDWHDLRRAYGTRIGAKNGPASVKQAMGHRDYRTSLLYIAAVEIDDDLAPPAMAPTVSPARSGPTPLHSVPGDTMGDTIPAKRATR